LVEQTPPTLLYMDVHYATRLTTTRIFRPQSDCGWRSGWRETNIHDSICKNL